MSSVAKTCMRVVSSFLLVMSFAVSFSAFAQATSAERLRSDTVQNVKSRATTLLDKYCSGACELINVNVTTEEHIDEEADLGFESLSNDAGRATYAVRDINIEIQVDDKVAATNRDRIQAILLNHLRSFGIDASISWRPVRLPTFGKTLGTGDALKAALERKITQALTEVINSYCPDQCVLAQVSVAGAEITPDEASALPRAQVYRSQDGDDVIRVDDVQVAVELDERLGDSARERIGNVMRAKTRFVAPIHIELNSIAFPEPQEQRQRRLDAQMEDPFSLDKLRQMLTMFRELAGTKEIITNNSSTTSNNTSESSKIANTTSSSLSEKQRTSDVKSTSETSAAVGGQSVEWAIYLGAFILLAGLIVAVFLRVLAANRDAKVMVAGAGETAPAVQPSFVERIVRGRDVVSAEASAPAATGPNALQVTQRLRNDQLRSDLMRIIVDAPKVARDTFTRMLREDGVEATARYVHLLGHIVVFELIDDPGLKSNLVELSEFYHRSNFSFTAEEEHALLQTLKTRFTASEIRVLTRKTNDQFDFLTKLTPSQIFQLIADERAQIQSVVLAQIERGIRMQVYDMFRGQSKVALLQELSKGDSVPRDYLHSVAQAMARKAQTRPEFDAENLRGSDILLDLLQRSDLQEQRQLVANISRTNPDTARSIKTKLVTVETLSFLKDGLLIEVVLGMQRAELLTFLRGTRQHIRNLLLNKAPRELAESWYEELQTLGPIDDTQYRPVEAKVIGRLQGMANAGSISILGINEAIFGGGNAMPVSENTNVRNSLPQTPPSVPVARNIAA